MLGALLELWMFILMIGLVIFGLLCGIVFMVVWLIDRVFVAPIRKQRRLKNKRRM